MSVSSLIGVSIASLMLVIPSSAAGSRHADIWLAPLQPLIRQDGAHAGAADYFSLFDEDAEWSYVAANTKVFKIYPELLQQASDDQLRRLISNLAFRHIGLALETPVLSDTVECRPGGKHLRWMVGVAGRIKQLGGNLKALAMVGPVVDGHVSKKEGSCQSSLYDVAKDALQTIKPIRAIFPDLLVGEIEPLGSGPGYPKWSELQEWLTTFEHVTGQPIAFFHVDVEWGHDWASDLKFVAKQMQLAGIPLGVIYDGTSMDLSDSAFALNALLHADQVEATLGHRPDQVIIQSWQDYPRKALPESNNTTMTGIVKAYLRQRTRFAEISDASLRLVTEDGHAIADAEIVIEAHDPIMPRSLQPQSLVGTVPHGARTALVALRVHAECGTCSTKAANFWISKIEVTQKNRAAAMTNLEAATENDFLFAGSSFRHYEVSSAQALMLNGSAFPVEPDSPFLMQFSWQVEPSSDGTGSIGLVFMGMNGREVNRTVLPLRTSWTERIRLLTNADGLVFFGKGVRGFGQAIRVRYAGDEQNQPTMQEL